MVTGMRLVQVVKLSIHWTYCPVHPNLELLGHTFCMCSSCSNLGIFWLNVLELTQLLDSLTLPTRIQYKTISTLLQSTVDFYSLTLTLPCSKRVAAVRRGQASHGTAASGLQKPWTPPAAAAETPPPAHRASLPPAGAGAAGLGVAAAAEHS